MANQVLVPPRTSIVRNAGHADLHLQQLMASLEQSWWSSLKNNLHDAFFPEKLPPLKLTSQPVKVREIWGDYNNRKQATVGTTVVHAVMVAFLIAISIIGAREVKKQIQQPTVELVAPDVSTYVPVSNKRNDTIGGACTAMRRAYEFPVIPVTSNPMRGAELLYMRR